MDDVESMGPEQDSEEERTEEKIINEDAEMNNGTSIHRFNPKPSLEGNTLLDTPSESCQQPLDAGNNLKTSVDRSSDISIDQREASTTPTRRRPGRPKGSKNKPKPTPRPLQTASFFVPVRAQGFGISSQERTISQVEQTLPYRHETRPSEALEMPIESADKEIHPAEVLARGDAAATQSADFKSLDHGDSSLVTMQNRQRANYKLLEEYKIWKKNAPFLYDLMLSTALEWPTLTTQWLPDKQSPPDKPYATHRLLLGTHTSNDQPNFLQIAHVQLPKSSPPDPADYDEDKGEIGGYGGGSSKKKPPAEVKFHIVQKIKHQGEVNKARYMPQNPNIIATMCTNGTVMIWDRTKHPSTPTDVVNPQIELHGHTKEGFALSWSPHEAGKLATGSEDETVRLWDINEFKSTNKLLKPKRTYTHHSSIVNDVQHHPIHAALIGTVSDDLTLQILDTRSADTTKSAATGASGHTDAVNAIAFNPASESVVATGSADKTIGIWDLRNLKHKLHALEGHNESVTSLAWHPNEQAVLASSSYDRRILFWDLSRVGEEQTPDDAADGPPELLFMHGGHTNRISDFSWNLNDPWVICSAAEDNLIQVWKLSDTIVGKDIEDIPTDELES